jgi:hypothetical protein
MHKVLQLHSDFLPLATTQLPAHIFRSRPLVAPKALAPNLHLTEMFNANSGDMWAQNNNDRHCNTRGNPSQLVTIH